MRQNLGAQVIYGTFENRDPFLLEAAVARSLANVEPQNIGKALGIASTRTITNALCSHHRNRVELDVQGAQQRRAGRSD